MHYTIELHKGYLISYRASLYQIKLAIYAYVQYCFS